MAEPAPSRVNLSTSDEPSVEGKDGLHTQPVEKFGRWKRVLAATTDKPRPGVENADAGRSGTQEKSLLGERQIESERPPATARDNSGMIRLAQINEMVSDEKMNMHTYEIAELRDGFFDALFLDLSKTLSDEELLEKSRHTLPAAFRKGDPLSASQYIPHQWRNMKSLLLKMTTTRAGIRLVKAFLAVFIAYVLCLVVPVRNWLGRYSYIMVISAIINHPSRAFGSQIDGTILTSIGMAAGLGWGVVGLLLSTSTLSASAGYGGILALFLMLFMAVIGWLRAFFTRFFQGVLCAGIGITFTVLADTNDQSVRWPKLRSFAIPWLLGQAIALLVNMVVFPEAGTRSLATSFRNAHQAMQDALIIPRIRDTTTRRGLSKAFVELSTAYRDMRIDITITRFEPDDIRILRNLMQRVIRSLLSIETETSLFDGQEFDLQAASKVKLKGDRGSVSRGFAKNVVEALAPATSGLLEGMREGLARCHAVLMDMSGYRSQLGPPREVSSDVGPLQIRLKLAEATFDSIEANLLSSGELPTASMHDSNAVQLLVFTRHVREASATVQQLMVKVLDMQASSSGWPKPRLPSYPFWKAVHRTNPQVRHDRGGITAGSYLNTFEEIAKQLDKIKSKAYKPKMADATVSDTDGNQTGDEEGLETSYATMTADVDTTADTDKKRLGYRIWQVLHRLQGFESTYSLKLVIVTSLLSVPSYLSSAHDWWNRYEAWWAVSIAWIMMHPRVGGNFQDLLTRAFFAVLGAVWSGVAYAAGQGNPVVLGVFAAIYYMPMMYRFTQSAHTRSGLIGCFSFTVISLRLHTNGGNSSPTMLCVFGGVAFVVGVVAPIIVNWILWPFVARHELRSALSSMLFFMSILYRNTLAKYIYFNAGEDPSEADIRNSEILEGRLREGFVRIRQLLVMTHHEIRLRGPMDPLPYSSLADAAERFFEHLVAVRQSALFYVPSSVRDNPLGAEALLTYRRDAVAVVLANLYVLSGALRSQRPVPRYLPSAAAARKQLLLKLEEVEREVAPQGQRAQGDQQVYADIYSYSYNQSLTGCVAQLEELERYVKLIVGEQSFRVYQDMEDEANCEQ